MRRSLVLFLVCCCVRLTAWQVEILSESPKIVLIHDFLSDDECAYLIELARPILKRSTVVNESASGASKVDKRRTSEGAFLSNYYNESKLQKIEKKLSALTDYPRENGESIQVLHYGIGAEYRPHYDYFNPQTPGGASHLKRGGQRLATVIMYLNTPIEGGETVFPQASISVTPKKRNALLFYNCLPSGETDRLSLHGGAPVAAGEKWIATKWFRAKKFRM